MKFKFNPITGNFDYTSNSANKQKFNPVTWEFNLVEGDGPFSQIFNPLTWKLNLALVAVLAEVTGNWYINLTNAVKNSLQELKAYWGTEQNSLPSWYTQLEYLESTGKQYIISPYIVNNKTVFYCRYNETQDWPQTANVIFWVTSGPDVSKANFGIARLTWRSFNRVAWGDSTSGSVIDTYAPKEFWEWYEAFYDRNKLYINNTLYATSATSNDTQWQAQYWLWIFARSWSSVTMLSCAKISSAWAKEDWEFVLNLIPAKRNSDNVLGMYDTVSNTFLINRWTWVFTAWPNAVLTPSPETPMNIICNNGVIKVDNQGQIYCDWATETITDELWNTATCQPLLKIWDYEDMQEILSWGITRNVGIKVLDGTENRALATATNLVQFYATDTQWIIANDVSLVSSIAPYWCTIANRTEYQFWCFSWSNGNLCFQMQWSSVLRTVDAFKQFLTDQYNAWTPVIVVYPLATPTTETVTWQTMNVKSWNNTIEITQASLDNLKLYAKYLSAN